MITPVTIIEQFRKLGVSLDKIEKAWWFVSHSGQLVQVVLRYNQKREKWYMPEERDFDHYYANDVLFHDKADAALVALEKLQKEVSVLRDKHKAEMEAIYNEMLAMQKIVNEGG